jgi:hypothetical protein
MRQRTEQGVEFRPKRQPAAENLPAVVCHSSSFGQHDSESSASLGGANASTDRRALRCGERNSRDAVKSALEARRGEGGAKGITKGAPASPAWAMMWK